MKRTIFSGRVHPERATLALPIQEHRWAGKDGNEKGRIRFKIDFNQITAVIDWHDEAESVYTLRNIVKSEIEVATGVIGFLFGYSWDVEITNAFEETLTSASVFNIGIPALEGRFESSGIAPLVSAVYPLCFGDGGAFLRRAFADLGMAIRHADDTAFYCYRALESLKQYFAWVGEVDGDRQQWEAMAAAIGGTRDEVEPIRQLAFPARHGVPKPTSDAQRRDIFLTTWRIVERFLDFRLKETGGGYRLDQFRTGVPEDVSDNEAPSVQIAD